VSAANINLSEMAVGAGLMLIVFVAFSIWSRKHGVTAVGRWATAQGLSLVSVKRRSFVPRWPLLSSRRFQFFRVIVKNQSGETRRAWMRLEADGSEPEIVEVAWDDEESIA